MTMATFSALLVINISAGPVLLYLLDFQTFLDAISFLRVRGGGVLPQRMACRVLVP